MSALRRVAPAARGHHCRDLAGRTPSTSIRNKQIHDHRSASPPAALYDVEARGCGRDSSPSTSPAIPSSWSANMPGSGSLVAALHTYTHGAQGRHGAGGHRRRHRHGAAPWQSAGDLRCAPLQLDRRKNHATTRCAWSGTRLPVKDHRGRDDARDCRRLDRFPGSRTLSYPKGAQRVGRHQVSRW